MTNNNNQKRKQYYKIVILVVGIAIMQIFWVDVAFAENIDKAFLPVEKVMEAIVGFITGKFGRLAATIAVIGLGFLAFAGRLSWFMAGAVIIGMGLVFGAQGIVEQLAALAGSAS